MTTRRTRPGVTLVEVLVAMFVMALGLLALLTLFPLGAMQMAQSLKDDRSKQTAQQADAFMQAYWRHSVRTGSNPQDIVLTQALNDPNSGPPAPYNALPYPSPFTPLPPQLMTQVGPVPLPSYPVLVDPLGVFARTNGSPEQFWVSPATAPRLPRRYLALAAYNSTLAVQTCCLVDDMTFQQNGQPNPTLDRQGRYTWAAIVQRPRNNAPDVANLTILVFDGRPPLLAAPGDEVVVQLAPGALVPGARSVQLDVPNRSTDQLPLVRKGGWIMDGTIDPNSGVRNANFYRIAGVTEGAQGATTTTYVLDLDTPIKGPVSLTGAQIYLFAGLAEVFERPPLQPDPNLP
jgi:prepilin-type N-terminal cleavage/methylation domain-containing protein